jgi:hypothetical protein
MLLGHAETLIYSENVFLAISFASTLGSDTTYRDPKYLCTMQMIVISHHFVDIALAFFHLFVSPSSRIYKK